MEKTAERAALPRLFHKRRRSDGRFSGFSGSGRILKMPEDRADSQENRIATCSCQLGSHKYRGTRKGRLIRSCLSGGLVLGATGSSLFHQFKQSASQRSGSGGQKYAASGSPAPHFSSSASPRSRRVQPSSRTSRDGGMVGQRHGKHSRPRRKTIQPLHSSEAPTSPEGEKGPFCFLACGDRAGPDKPGGGRRVLGCLPQGQ